jgi:hypothetical protein
VDDLGVAGKTRGGSAAEHNQLWRAPARWRHGSSGAFKAMTQGHEDGGALVPFWSSGAPVATHPPAGASAAMQTTWAGQQARDATVLRAAGNGSEMEARD